MKKIEAIIRKSKFDEAGMLLELEMKKSVRSTEEYLTVQKIFKGDVYQ